MGGQNLKWNEVIDMNLTKAVCFLDINSKIENLKGPEARNRDKLNSWMFGLCDLSKNWHVVSF